MQKALMACALACSFSCATPSSENRASRPAPPVPAVPVAAAAPASPEPACRLAKPVRRMWLGFGDQSLERFEEKTLASHQIQEALNGYLCRLAATAEPARLSSAEQALRAAVQPEDPARIKQIMLKDSDLRDATAVLWAKCKSPAPSGPEDPECELAWEAALTRQEPGFHVVALEQTTLQAP